MKAFWAVALILALVIAPPLLCGFLLPPGVSYVLSWVFIAIYALVLLAFFLTIAVSGLTAERNILTISLISVAIIGSIIVHFAYLFRAVGLKTSDGNITHGFYDAFYCSVATWTTLGYSDVLPSEGARHIAMIEATLGYLVMAMLISVFVAAITKPAR